MLLKPSRPCPPGLQGWEHSDASAAGTLLYSLALQLHHRRAVAHLKPCAQAPGSQGWEHSDADEASRLLYSDAVLGEQGRLYSTQLRERPSQLARLITPPALPQVLVHAIRAAAQSVFHVRTRALQRPSCLPASAAARPPSLLSQLPCLVTPWAAVWCLPCVQPGNYHAAAPWLSCSLCVFSCLQSADLLHGNARSDRPVRVSSSALSV